MGFGPVRRFVFSRSLFLRASDDVEIGFLQIVFMQEKLKKGIADSFKFFSMKESDVCTPQ